MKQRVLFMIEGISAVTLGTDEMPRAVRHAELVLIGTVPMSAS
jgi:hypothetical protein